MNIVALCGGFSAERDVSLSTGAMAAAALRRCGHMVALVDTSREIEAVNFESSGSELPPPIGADAPQIAAPGARINAEILSICRLADIVFLALHGEDGEDGKIQAALDLYGVKYTGSGVLGSALAMDKSAAKDMLTALRVPMPRGITLRRGDIYNLYNPGLRPADVPSPGFPQSADAHDPGLRHADLPNPGFPCIVKPCRGGSSVGTTIAADENAYPDALEAAFRYGDTVLIEEFIRGREFAVGVLAGRALPIIEICPPEGDFYSYAAKYQAGAATEICPADLPPDIAAEMTRLALAAFDALRLEVYARMDFMLAGKTIYCLEANTLPGLTPTSLLPQEASAAGILYDELIETILRESLNKYK